MQPMLTAEGQSPEQGSSESSEVPIASPSSKWRSPDLDSRDDPRQDTTLSEAVTSLNFWLLFYVLLVGMGFGITVSNNLGMLPIPQPMVFTARCFCGHQQSEQ